MWNNCKENTINEMRAFIGIILNMWTFTLHKIGEYFSQEYTHKISFFCNLQIFWILHLNENLSKVNNDNGN